MPEKSEVKVECPEGPGPEWLDDAFLAECLGENAAALGDVRISPAVPEGSNYCSCMWRVRLSVNGKPESLIVKGLPKGDLMQTFVTNLGFFPREMKMFQETLPALEAVAADRCGADSELTRPLAARGLPCSRPQTLVVKDLCAHGYRNAVRQLQLDMQHTKMALEALARLHALSVAKHREDPDSMESYVENMFLPRSPGDVPPKDHFTITLFRKFADEIETWTEMERRKEFAEKLRDVAELVYDRIVATVQPNQGQGALNVLNHGDFWINNFMYKYASDKSQTPLDVLMVDLQMCRFSSPALDLQYFIQTSPREEIRLQHLDALLEHYRATLNRYLTALGVEDMTLSAEQLRKEYDAKALFGLNASVSVLCAVVAEPSDRLQLDDMTVENAGECDPMKKAWQGKTFRRVMPKILENYIDAGVI